MHTQLPIMCFLGPHCGFYCFLGYRSMSVISWPIRLTRLITIVAYMYARMHPQLSVLCLLGQYCLVLLHSRLLCVSIVGIFIIGFVCIIIRIFCILVSQILVNWHFQLDEILPIRYEFLSMQIITISYSPTTLRQHWSAKYLLISSVCAMEWTRIVDTVASWKAVTHVPVWIWQISIHLRCTFDLEHSSSWCGFVWKWNFIIGYIVFQ